MTSECRNRLCGMTTAPSTLITMAAEPAGKLGLTHETAACGQSTFTSASSARKARPMSETNAIIQRSMRLYELVASMATEKAPTMTLPTRTGCPKSIWSAMAPPRTSAIAVATVAAYAVARMAVPSQRGKCLCVASARHSPVAIPRWAALCCSRMSIRVESVTTHSNP